MNQPTPWASKKVFTRRKGRTRRMRCVLCRDLIRLGVSYYQASGVRLAHIQCGNEADAKAQRASRGRAPAAVPAGLDWPSSVITLDIKFPSGLVRIDEEGRVIEHLDTPIDGAPDGKSDKMMCDNFSPTIS